jgi:hypothetical protein
MEYDVLAIPLFVLAVLLAIIFLVMGNKAPKLRPEQFAKAVINQNKEVFDRLATM